MTKIHRFIAWATAVAAVASLALSSGAAQARDVYWSVGIGSPGVHLGVSNAPRYQPPVYYAPAYVHPHRQLYGPPAVYHSQPPVVYSQPQVYYSQPAVVYHQPQVIYTQPPYYVQSTWSPPVYYRHGGHHRHGPHRGWDRDGRRGDRR